MGAVDDQADGMTDPLKRAWKRWDADWRATWSEDLDAPGSRQRAAFDALVFDHGFLRLLWTNRGEVVPGVWRMNQPSRARLDRLAAEGLKTVLNVRGASDWGSYFLEREACARLGLALIDHRLRSRGAPSAEQVLGLLEIFETAERPLLIHCKSGADRAGLAAAICRLGAGHPPRLAAAELSLRYLHIRAAKTGILDAFVEAYADAHEATGIGFRTWVTEVYDRDALEAAFKAGRAGSFLVDWILRRE
ncbi:MAG: sulfur transferase domain-containing protein [Pseudomonadota bacterium]